MLFPEFIFSRVFQKLFIFTVITEDSDSEL